MNKEINLNSLVVRIILSFKKEKKEIEIVATKYWVRAGAVTHFTNLKKIHKELYLDFRIFNKY